MAGALSNLKLEIKSLANIFDQKHPRFQFVAALDEITCKFISDNDKNNSIELKASLPVIFDYFGYSNLQSLSTSTGFLSTFCFNLVYRLRRSRNNESPLYQDLLKLKASTGKEGILLHIIFKGSYPFEPPFVRVAEPVISRKTRVFNRNEI